MRVLSVREIKRSEQRAAEYGLTKDVLIENAAAALKEAVLSLTEQKDRICVLCGGGNNGADGLSLARMLHLCGRNVTVVTVSERFNAFAKARLDACRKLGVPEIAAADFLPGDYVLAVDAMLGTGCDRPLDGEIKTVAEKLNDSEIFTLAVDLPTGLNADSGECETAVIANETLTFSFAKTGHIIGQGRNYCGNLVIADIGLRSDEGAQLVTRELIELPERKPVSHKYDYGRVRVIAGSPEMIGASLLAHESAISALKSGAGLATLCVPASLKAIYQARVKEETLAFLPDRDGKIIYDPSSLAALTVKTGAILIGPGMGKNDDLAEIVKYFLKNFDGTLVLDADAINAFEGRADELTDHKCKLILTPHMGEFERLTKGQDFEPFITVAEKVKALALKLDAVIAAKSATTIISDGKDIYLNTTGTPALSKGGSGDVLGGMIAAFGCRMPPLKAAMCGCYHFGKCAEVAETVYGTESLLASNISVR